MPAPVDPSSVIVLDPRGAPVPPGRTDAIAQLVRICFGALSLTEGVVLTRNVERGPAPVAAPPTGAVDAVDLIVGTAWGVARLGGRVAASGGRVAAPVGRLLARPPLLPLRLQPAQGAQRVVEGWLRDRPGTVRSFHQWSATTWNRSAS